MSDLLALAATRFPEEYAVVTSKEALSYRDLDARVHALAARLQDVGIRSERRLCTVLSTTVEHMELLLAGLRLGALLAPLNPRWPVALIEETIQNLHADYVISDRVLSVNDTATLFVSELMASPSSSDYHESGQGTIAIHTSGSLGKPKAAVLTPSNLVHNARLSNRNIPVLPGDRWLLSLPLYHVSGLGVVYRCMTGGGAVAIPDLEMTIPNAVASLTVTHISMVPKQLHVLFHDDRAIEHLRRLTAILLGGGPIPESVRARAENAGIPIAITYGLTEMASQVATTSPGECHDRSAPVLAPDTVRLDENGVIQVRGPCLFTGYLDTTGLHRPITSDGWFDTGDLGEWACPGRLRVLGRRDNRFKSMGEWVSPERIEAELVSIPGIAEAIVVPVPDETQGTAPVAFLEYATAGIDALHIREVLSRKLPQYMIPQRFLAWPEDLAKGHIKPHREAFRRRALE